MAGKQLTKWRIHLDDTREKNPKLTFGECMKEASKTYTEKNVNSKPKKPKTAEGKIKSKIKRLQKQMDSLTAAEVAKLEGVVEKLN
jgi:hypothetical protein